MRARTSVLVVCGLLFLSACSSARDALDDSRSAGTSDAPPTASATPSPTPSPTPSSQSPPVDKSLPNIIGSIDSFTSPTGNIGCYISSDSARCDIRDRTFSPPPEPEECGLDWGNSVEVAADVAGFACVGDTVMGSEATLKYGNSTVVGDFGCRSTETGVTCINRKTMHGFLISRAAVQTF